MHFIFCIACAQEPLVKKVYQKTVAPYRQCAVWICFRYEVYGSPIRCCKCSFFFFVCFMIHAKNTKHFSVKTSVVFIVKMKLFVTQNTSMLTNWHISLAWVVVVCKTFFFLFFCFNIIVWGRHTSRTVSLKYDFCRYEEYNNF